MWKPTPAKFFGMGLFIVIAIIAFGAVTMLLWNWLIPTIFSGPTITYWQAIGLLLLSKILLSGGPGRHGHRHHPGKRHWKRHLRDKMEHDEEWCQEHYPKSSETEDANDSDESTA